MVVCSTYCTLAPGLHHGKCIDQVDSPGVLVVQAGHSWLEGKVSCECPSRRQHLDVQEPSLVQEAPEDDRTGAVEDPEGQEGSVAQCLSRVKVNLLEQWGTFSVRSRIRRGRSGRRNLGSW